MADDRDEISYSYDDEDKDEKEDLTEQPSEPELAKSVDRIKEEQDQEQEQKENQDQDYDQEENQDQEQEQNEKREQEQEQVQEQRVEPQEEQKQEPPPPVIAPYPSYFSRRRNFARWCTARTNFETGILLVMMLAIPFLLIMIAIYIHESRSPPSQPCVDLCQAMEKKIKFSSKDRFELPERGGIPPRTEVFVEGEVGAKKPNTRVRNRTKSGGAPPMKKKMGYYIPVDGLGNYDIFEISDSQTVAPEIFQHHEIGNITNRTKRYSEIPVPLACNITLTSPAIVALLENLHRDDDSQQVYKCMGLMWPPDILLTSNLCLRDFLEGFDLKIRINSTFWSKNGLIWDVKSSDYEHINSHFKRSKDPFLTVLGIRRGLQENNICVQPHLLVHPKVKFATGLFFTWSSDLSLPLKRRTKFSALRSQKVHLKYESDIILGSSKNPRECLNDLGGPLMSPNGKYVLGILLYTDCQNGTTYYFANLQLSHYIVFPSK